MLTKSKLFFDSSALIAGVLSRTGAACVLMLFAEQDKLDLYISEHVIEECERSLARKAPAALPAFRNALKDTQPKIVAALASEEIQPCLYMIADPTDAPILAAAIKAKVDFLVTHNRRHFLDDPKVAEKSGLKIGTPGDALAWIRENL
ncbi:MAG: PIN domain-containing protein [Chloroflexota bacterium]